MLAFTWIPAIAIAGGILAAGPIIIHLLNRRRFKVLDWAAMRFLLESRRKNRRRLRLEELLLLAIRVLVLLLMGLMLADIVAASILAGPGASVAHVFVLDDSLSMGQRLGAESLLEKAAAHLAALIASLPERDVVAVVSATRPRPGDRDAVAVARAGHPLGRLVFAQDLAREGFPRRLRALQPTDLRADFSEALAAAGEILSARPDVARRLYLVSDFRRADFADPAAAPALRAAVDRLAEAAVSLVLLDYGAPAAANLTVERVELLDKIAVAGLAARFQAWVRNHGPEPVQGASLTVETGACGDAAAGVAALPAIPLGTIAPGETVGRPFACTFAHAGPAWLKVAATPDPLPADNVAWLALQVRAALRVLVVDGAPDPTSPTRAASFCLASAIDPRGTGAFGQQADVVALENLPGVNFDDYDAVFLANVGDLAPARDPGGSIVYPQLEALERYVRQGGGLGVFLGDRVSLDFYNGPMFADGSGLSPLRLGASVPATLDRDQFVRLRPDSIASVPMLRLFTGRSEQFTRLVRFYRYMPAREAAPPRLAEGVGPAEVLARFDDRDGSPACVRRRFGKGQVIVWYTSADVRWTDWPKDLTFLPVVNDMTWELARRSGEAFHDLAGRPVRYVLPPALYEATAVEIKTPAYPAQDVTLLQPEVQGTDRVVEYAATDRAGIYELKLTLADRTEHEVLFSRAVDPAEGDLAKAEQSELREVLGREFTYQSGLALGAAVGTAEDQKAYWWLFMVAVLGLLGLETLLAQRFGHYAAPPREGA